MCLSGADRLELLVAHKRAQAGAEGLDHRARKPRYALVDSGT
jgi:hypothetical protein